VGAPLLVVVNGAPAAGKTTVARAWADARPGALAIDVDAIKEQIDDWREWPIGAGLAARERAVELAAAHLLTGNSVVLSQLYGRVELIEALEVVARSHGARLVELLLVGDREVLRARFEERGGVQAEMAGPLGFDELYDRAQQMPGLRPDTIVIDTTDADEAELLRRVSEATDRHP
jgi:predicted kinase